MSYMNETNINELVGKTLTNVIVDRSGREDEIIFDTTGGEQYRMYHDQDCCESVYIDDICGDLSDLIGSPILIAEEATNCNENPDGVPPKEYQDESFTWTFYKIDTAKGGVTIRWYSESNGYYSESVDFEKVEKDGDVCVVKE